MKLVSNSDHQLEATTSVLASLSHTVPRIGIEEELYTVSEDDGVLEVCVVVFAPFYDCSKYIFQLSSTNDTAGKYFFICTCNNSKGMYTVQVMVWIMYL